MLCCQSAGGVDLSTTQQLLVVQTTERHSWRRLLIWRNSIVWMVSISSKQSIQAMGPWFSSDLFPVGNILTSRASAVTLSLRTTPPTSFHSCRNSGKIQMVDNWPSLLLWAWRPSPVLMAHQWLMCLRLLISWIISVSSPPYIPCLSLAYLSIAIMNYDIWGSWSNTVGPNAPLDDSCAAVQAGSATSAVKAWTGAGFPASKVGYSCTWPWKMKF